MPSITSAQKSFANTLAKAYQDDGQIDSNEAKNEILDAAKKAMADTENKPSMAKALRATLSDFDKSVVMQGQQLSDAYQGDAAKQIGDFNKSLGSTIATGIDPNSDELNKVADDGPFAEIILGVVQSISGRMQGAYGPETIAFAVDQELGVYDSAGQPPELQLKLDKCREKRFNALQKWIADIPDLKDRVRQQLNDSMHQFALGKFGGDDAMADMERDFNSASDDELQGFVSQAHQMALQDPGSSFALRNQSQAFAELRDVALDILQDRHPEENFRADMGLED